MGFENYSDTVDSLVEESGCRIENPLAMKLRVCFFIFNRIFYNVIQDSIQKADWLKALEIIDKLQGQLTEKQYISVRVLLLEEKFKELMNQQQVSIYHIQPIESYF